MNELNHWLDRNGYSIKKMARSWQTTVPNVRQAAEQVFEISSRRKIRPIRIGWEIRERLQPVDIEPYIESLQYEIWQLKRPWLERFMEPFHYWVW